MHDLLRRQLRRHFGTASLPNELRAFIDDVDSAYRQADDDRALLERSLELSGRDLMERYEAMRLQQIEQEIIFNSVPALIFHKDAHNRILRVNAQGAQAMGRPATELEGRSTYDLMPHDVAKKLHDDDLEVVRSGRAKVGIVESHPDANGSLVWARTDKVPYRDADGRVVGVLVFSQDITEQKRAEQNLIEANAKLQELLKFRTQFLNTAAHELGTPLTPILIQVHLLRRAVGKTTPAIAGSLDVLERSIRRLEMLVRDVLEAARLQAGRLPLRRAPLDLSTLARQAVDAVEGQARQGDVHLELVAEPKVMVLGDGERLAQVLGNLLSNALKFTRPRGAVIVAVTRMGAAARVGVRDTGVGLAAEAIGRLFEPFTQVHDPMQVTAPGTGLGLYVCRGIVEQHQGHIACESEGPGHGATFWFEVPLIEAQNAAPVAAPAPSGRTAPA